MLTFSLQTTTTKNSEKRKYRKKKYANGKSFLFIIYCSKKGGEKNENHFPYCTPMFFSSCACFYFKKVPRHNWKEKNGGCKNTKWWQWMRKISFSFIKQCQGGKKETFFLYIFGGIRREFSHYMYDNVFSIQFSYCSVLRHSLFVWEKKQNKK